MQKLIIKFYQYLQITDFKRVDILLFYFIIRQYVRENTSDFILKKN